MPAQRGRFTSRNARVLQCEQAVRIIQIQPCVHGPERHRFVVVPDVEPSGEASRRRAVGRHAGIGNGVLHRDQLQLSVAGQECIQQDLRVSRVKLAVQALGIELVETFPRHVRASLDKPFGQGDVDISVLPGRRAGSLQLVLGALR